MGQPGWFECEDDLDEVQAVFLSVLRCRAAAGWDCDPADTDLALPEYVRYGSLVPEEEAAAGKMLVYLDIPDPARNASLLTVGAYLDLDQVRGDKLHNQLLSLPDTATPLGFQATGSPAELGEATADWFEGLLSRPIEYREWLRWGQPYAHQWVFADTGRALVEGRVRPDGLGAPGRVTHVRGGRRP